MTPREFEKAMNIITGKIIGASEVLAMAVMSDSDAKQHAAKLLSLVAERDLLSAEYFNQKVPA